MNSIFSYESPPMQALMRLGDLIILNLLYLVCCIPVVTIGAAQAGLYTACRVMQDKEDDSSLVDAFWRGFSNGFKTVTISWSILTVVLVLMIWIAGISVAAGGSMWLSILPVVVCAVFQALVPAFHSRFSCTPWQLIRNSWFLLFAHPLRSLLITGLLWLPVALFLTETLISMYCTPIWVVLYYSTVFSAATSVLKKPFRVLVEHFNETHGVVEQAPVRSPDAVFTDVPETDELDD